MMARMTPPLDGQPEEPEDRKDEAERAALDDSLMYYKKELQELNICVARMQLQLTEKQEQEEAATKTRQESESR